MACLEDRFDSLAVVVDHLGQHTKRRSMDEMDRHKRFEQHMSAIESVCSRICVDKVQDQLKEFFDVHVSRLDDLCEKLKAELEEKGSSHIPQEASADVVPTTEPRRYCAATAQRHAHIGSCHKFDRSRSLASIHGMSKMNDFGGTSTRNGDCAVATKTVSGSRHCSGSSLSSPLAAHRNTDPVRKDATKTVSFSVCGSAVPVRDVAAHPLSSLSGNRCGGIIASSSGLGSTKANSVDSDSTQDSKSMLKWWVSDASGIHDGSCGSFGQSRVGDTVPATLASSRASAPCLCQKRVCMRDCGLTQAIS